MNLLKPIALSALLLATVEAGAQINIPVANVSLDYALGNSTYAISLNLGGVNGSGGTNRSVYVDPFKISTAPGTITGSTATTTNAQEIATIKATALWFCMDPLQTIQFAGSGAPAGSTLVYNSTSAADFNKYNNNTAQQANPPSSYGGGLNSLEITDLQKLFTANYANAAKDNFTAAALQIAIWEVVNESNDGTHAAKYQLENTYYSGGTLKSGAGNFSITSSNTSLIQTAQGMLNSLATYNAPFTGKLDYLVDGTYTSGAGTTVVVQDLIGWEAPIPESGNFAVGALGLLSLAAIGKLRSRKSKLTAATTS